jgi:hypothetical protein
MSTANNSERATEDDGVCLEVRRRRAWAEEMD